MKKGQMICLLGPNRAGKSTILRTLSGLLAPVSGTVQIGGTNISSLRENALAKKAGGGADGTVRPCADDGI